MAGCLCFIIQMFTRNCTLFYVLIFNFQDFSRRILINSAYSIINSNKKLLILSSNHIGYYSKKYLHKIKSVSFLSVLIIKKEAMLFSIGNLSCYQSNMNILCVFIMRAFRKFIKQFNESQKKEKQATTRHMTGQGFH